jgi:hypothetical protein
VAADSLALRDGFLRVNLAAPMGAPVFHTAKDAVAWMADRFAGKPAPDECVKRTP